MKSVWRLLGAVHGPGIPGYRHRRSWSTTLECARERAAASLELRARRRWKRGTARRQRRAGGRAAAARILEPPAPVTEPTAEAPAAEPASRRQRRPAAAAAAPRQPTPRVGHAGRTLRHPMGGLGRRPGAGARRHFPGALLDRAGLLGPGVRIFLGALFAGAADRRRRMGAAPRNRHRHRRAFQPAHIPSILTAAGTIVAYATVYAAYALYDFLSPAAGLRAARPGGAGDAGGGAAARAGARRARPGRRLSSRRCWSPRTQPNYWALYVYLAVVTAAAFALARMRLWRWLAITAVVLGALWMLPGVDYPHVDALGAHLFHVVAGFALAAALIVSGLLYGPSAEPGKIDEISSGALAAYLLGAALLVLASVHDSAALAIFTVLTAATVAIAWRTRGRAAVRCRRRGLLAVLVMLHWATSTMLRDAGAARRRHRRRHSRVRRPATRIASGARRRRSRCCSALPAISRKAAPTIRWSRSCGARPRCSRRS